MSKFCRPPRKFRQVKDVRTARISGPPDFLPSKRRYSGVQAEGKRYEAKVLAMLEKRYGKMLLPSPWFSFNDYLGGGWCQPDGLIFDLEYGRISIVEVKLQHTASAWWQLFRKYRPVVAAVFPEDRWRLCCVEIVNWYDPGVAFPTEPFLRRDLDDLRADKANVHIWNPRVNG